MYLSHILFGAILLLAGRKFFWLFVGIVGFLVGMQYGGLLLADAPSWVVLLISVVIGVVGAVAAVFAQWMVVALSGFAGGGYLCVLLTQMLMPPSQLSGLFFLVGGVLGAIVMMMALDLALIVLSSLLGAALIAGAAGLPEGMNSTLALLVLTVVGVVVQSCLGSGERSKK